MNVFMMDTFCTIYKLKFNQLQCFLQTHGYTSTDSIDRADVVISGVCAAFEADEERSVRIMKQNSDQGVPHYTIGCLVTVNPARLKTDYSYATWQFAQLAEDLTGVTKSDYDNFPLPTCFRTKHDYRVYNPRRRFVGVTTGCGFECSYCPHRIGAGELSSRPVDSILLDVQSAISERANIIHLTGLDTASYGKDSGDIFGYLLATILDNVGHSAVFHIAQFNPEGLNGEDGAVFLRACSDNRVVDLQLPIQTASIKLLKMMNRNYLPDTVKDFIKRLRNSNPNIFLRTDIMVGVPTETEHDLDDTIGFVSPLFDEVAVYGYERKPVTPMANVPFAWEIPRETKSKRMITTIERLRSEGIIVHSGGQQLSSLLIVDKAKARSEIGHTASP